MFAKGFEGGLVCNGFDGAIVSQLFPVISFSSRLIFGNVLSVGTVTDCGCKLSMHLGRLTL